MTKWRGPHIVMVIGASHLVSSDLLFRLRNYAYDLSQSSTRLQLLPAVERRWIRVAFFSFLSFVQLTCVFIPCSALSIRYWFVAPIQRQSRCYSETLSASSVAISYMFIFTWHWSVFVRVHCTVILFAYIRSLLTFLLYFWLSMQLVNCSC